MNDPIVVGIDIGTTKVCTLVARLEGEHDMRILGVGIEPSQGIKGGSVVDIAAASTSISRSIEKAERTSGLEITSALVSLAGSHVSALNSRGVAGISGGVIDQDDVWRALDAAQAVAIPHNREVIHVIQRGFTVDGQEGIQTPIGFSGYRLEVEAHIITAASATVENLRQCVQASGVEVSQFVLNPLASAEVVLNKTERDMGVCVCDIGGGTSDLAIYVNGDVWHTMVLPVGGAHITQDIAVGLRVSPDQAEMVKKQHGFAVKNEVGEDEFFTMRAFGEEHPIQVSRRDLAHIIEARVDEIFSLLLQEIRRSGYDAMLPAGMVLTGGSSLLAGMRPLASRVLGMPVRIARPDNMIGLVDQLQSPSYATSVGLLKWAELMHETMTPATRTKVQKSHKRARPAGVNWGEVKNWLGRLLP
ncbi:MAG: cell division protein FtsA [Chloroflexi bacterium HGW-Chloroflexi-5]|nr:MAG: cell division protein FtsA [Chloroflexi bacterium HGW-Chloroflexi-5]